jgi:hypothetical protein
VGYTHWAGVGVQGHKMAHCFFQFVFAATAATLVSGAVAERCNFVAYITYSAVISGDMHLFCGPLRIVSCCKIRGIHGGDYEEWSLLRCYAVWLL